MKQGWWNTAIIPPLKKLTQEDYKFETRLAFIVRPISKKKKRRKEKVKEMSFCPPAYGQGLLSERTL
jgi:hypothetical protein